jgi:uncharacterized protein (DUF983 family)
MSLTLMQKCAGLILQRCPRCARGRIYERGMKMNPSCPVCELLFEREPGYFLGALYVSYFLASSILLAVFGVLHLLLPEWDLGYLVLLAGLLFVPFVPVVTRYARVIWIYFDRWAWPVRAGRSD